MWRNNQPPVDRKRWFIGETPNLEKVREAIKHLNHNKASGEDRILAELL
jgi:hypothetical protein